MAKGFTLIEVLVAATLLGVGVAAVMGGIRAVYRFEGRARDKEVMQRLAVNKFEEIRATTDTFAADDSGDFADQNIDGFVWEMKVEATGIENVDGVTITVRRQSAADDDPIGQVSGLVFVPPVDTTGADQ